MKVCSHIQILKGLHLWHIILKICDTSINKDLLFMMQTISYNWPMMIAWMVALGIFVVQNVYEWDESFIWQIKALFGKQAGLSEPFCTKLYWNITVAFCFVKHCTNCWHYTNPVRRLHTSSGTIQYFKGYLEKNVTMAFQTLQWQPTLLGRESVIHLSCSGWREPPT